MWITFLTNSEETNMEFKLVEGRITPEELEHWISLNVARVGSGISEHKCERVTMEAITDQKAPGCFGGIKFVANLKPVRK